VQIYQGLGYGRVYKLCFQIPFSKKKP